MPSRGERGQALPLAAVGIFIMCLGVLATLNLGQAVHQKIKLQNTADSAAYTLATMEARTFNYIALLNRTQIAHYNLAMVVQSYITWAGFQLAVMGQAVDSLRTLANVFDAALQQLQGCRSSHDYGPRCEYFYGRPVQAQINIALALAEQSRKTALTAYQQAATIGHQIVEAMAIFNSKAVWQSQFIRAAMINAHLLTGMQNHIQKMDPDLSFTEGKSTLLNWLVNSALNSIEYYQAFDRSAGVNPFVYSLFRDIPQLASQDFFIKSNEGGQQAAGDNDAAEAYKVMSELIHAGRPWFVADRRATISFNRVRFIDLKGFKQGATEFTSRGQMNGAEVSAIREEDNYPVGTFLSSDDFLRSASATNTGGIAQITWQAGKPLGDAIAAYEKEGKHLRYDPGSGSGLIHFQGDSTTVQKPTSAQGFALGPTPHSPKVEGHADWPGFAPFFKFNARADRTADYNQPSTWIFLNKHHEDFQTDGESHASGRAPWYANFSWSHGTEQASLDTTIGGPRNSYLFEGLTVVSRGMAYYHRPREYKKAHRDDDAGVHVPAKSKGGWTEHPNFFNPFWRARLAPIGQKLQAFWDRWVSSRIGSSSEDAAVQTAVNILRNAQMDLITAAISALVTH